MRRLTLLAAAAVVAAGCGSSAAKAPPAPPKPGPGHVLYRAARWAVVVDHGRAVAEHLVDGAWRADRTGRVKISILGPKPGSRRNVPVPQVAAELTADRALVESQLWVDGIALLVKGGGLQPTRGTIYGAPASSLRRGKHTAVAYGRTATHATAVAWTFSV